MWTSSSVGEVGTRGARVCVGAEELAWEDITLSPGEPSSGLTPPVLGLGCWGVAGRATAVRGGGATTGEAGGAPGGSAGSMRGGLGKKGRLRRRVGRAGG